MKNRKFFGFNLFAILILFTGLVFAQIPKEASNKKGNSDLIKSKSIQLLSPVGNETWKIGSTHTILWNSSQIQYVRIELSTTGGTSWRAIANSVPASTGRYEWTISHNNYNATKEARIRIYDVNDPSSISQSAANFTISQLDVNTPTAANKLKVYDTYRIRWTASSDISTIKIEYTTNGSLWENVVASENAALGYFDWVVPDNPSATAQLRITDINNPSVNIAYSDTFSIASLTLTSPNGGEEWFSGSYHTISWQSTNVTRLLLEYSIDNGLTWNTIDNGVDAGSGNYSWLVPYTPSNEVLVRISDANYSNVNDESDNKFTISSIKVTSPNGGEGWQIQSSQTVTWTTNISGNVKIELSTNGGLSFDNELISSVAANTGSYAVTVPDIPTSRGRIKVTSLDNPNIYDVSDHNFTIGDVSVTSPAGGEVWQSSTVQTIQWTYKGIAVVAIEYSADGGTTWNAITSATNASVGSYSWSIPSNLSGNNITIRVRDYYTGTNISDVSNAITITGLTLDSPVGWEVWRAGTTHNITWTANSSINNITIQYSSDNGGTWNDIAKNVTASDQSYSWNIPASLSSGQMLIKIINEDNTSIYSQSSSDFRIGSVALTSPVGGETVFASGTYSITWQASSSVSYVRLQYSTDGGNNFFTITNATDATSGSYTWNVPNVSSTTARIRISDSYGSEIADTSGSDFTIASLQVTSPNGAEGFKPGTAQNITWTSSSISNVKIEFSSDNGASWSTVAASVNAALDTYAWTVPSIITSQGIIRLSSVANSSFYDVSDNVFKIASLSVVSPNGGEHFQTDSTETISWSASSNVTRVNIELSTNNGTDWTTLASNQQADKDYSWTIGNTPSNQALIRVTDATNSNISDISDNTFNVERLHLLSPNGGDFFMVDSTVNITWNSSAVGNVKLEYSTNNGLIWNTITASSAASSGSYSWKVPDNATQEGLLRISDADNPADNIFDESDSNFTISAVYLISPNGGESYSVNSIQTIRWLAYSSVATVKLEYSTNNGSSWNLISSSETASNQSYNWTVPNAVTNNALIKITDNGNTSIYDLSDNAFSIGSMSLTSPNGGERWQVGSTHSITWNNISSILNIQIDYSTDNGSTWTNIANNVDATTESYDWTVPNTLTSEALIRLTDENDPTVKDESNSTFTIANISVTTPNGLDALKVGDSYAITWQSSNIPSIDIEYSSDNGANWFTVVTGVNAATELYNWTVPSDPTSTGLIRLRDSQYHEINDVSDQNFSIISLKLTSPVGGEGWTIGDSKRITWTHGGVSTIKIEYSSDNGTTWNTIVNNVNADDLYYNWTVPNSPSNRYFIKITDEARSNIYSMSSSNFTVGAINVTQPSSSTNWKSGTTQEIKWTATDGLNVVNLEYSTDNGSTWNTIENSVPASDQSYFWTIPGNISSATSIVRVSHGITGSEISAQSNLFTINSLQISSPNGGEYFQAGTTEKIQWSSSVVNAVDIEYSTNNGSSWHTIATSYPASNGFYNWNVPSNLSTKEGVVRIKDSNNSSILDSSDAVFTIGWVKMFIPAADSIWQSGKSYDIVWDASSSIDIVRLDYSTDMGTTSWNTITNSATAAADTFRWNIPANISSNQMQIRISDARSSLGIVQQSETFKVLTLDVVSPNGGENWQVGSTQNITWNYSSGLINLLNIYYSTDNGSSWNSIASNVNASAGSYSWTVPAAAAGNKTLIKIVNAQNTKIYDVSNSVFTINSLSVVSPVAGDEIQTGRVSKIKWTSSNISDVRIEYSTDNGTTWNTMVSSIAASLDEYDWTVPSGIATNQAKIRIYSRQDQSVQSESGLFAIKTLGLTQPSGSEIWQAGSQHNITWTSDLVTNVDIKYSTDNGANWNAIISNLNANSGSYAWTLPSNVSSTHAFVKIFESGNTQINDSNGTAFSIGNLAVTSPVVADVWQAGRRNKIKWNSASVQNVKLEYSLDNGSTWNTIVSSMAASLGEYDWTLPANVSSAQAVIRVTAVEDPTFNNTSGVFKIKLLEVSSPNGGEVWQSGAQKQITWTAGLVNQINIYYSADNGASWTSVASNVNAASGSYNWSLPAGVTTSSALIRLIDASDNDIRDSSNASFTIGNLAVTTPIATTQWQSGKTYTIEWTNTGLKNLKIDYTTNNGTSWNNVTASVAAGLGKYSWTLPAGISSNQAKVRLTSVEDSTFTAESNLFTIKNLALTSPNGGEVWQAGTTNKIKWNAGQVNQISIYYTTDGGTLWKQLAVNVNASLGNYDWAVPSTFNTTNAYVKLIDADNSGVNDSSESAFTIGNLNITSPVASSEWQADNTYPITWTSTGVTNIKLEYSVDNGSSWKTIVNSIDAAKGSYDWTIPAGTSAAQAMVRASAVSDFTFYDNSAAFVIKRLNLTSPAGGEYWLAGTSEKVTWTAGQINLVSIYYSTDGGTTFNSIAENVNASAGSYTWNIPANVTSNAALVKIIDVNNSAVKSQSDNLFTIGILSITSPAGGDEWQAGSKKTIKWSASNAGNIDLEYSLDGTSWTPIVSVNSTVQSYDWTIPTTLSSTTAFVRATSQNSTNIRAVSPAFTIKRLELTAPNGGESWLAGSSHNITWTSGAVNSINISLSTDGGSSWSVIKSNQDATVAQYVWNIPSNISTNNALIKIEDATNTSISDSSANVFSVSSLVITYPTGGERFQEGKTYSVKWDGANTFNEVSLEYSTDGGVNWITIVNSTPAANHSYDWTVPTGIATNRARVRVIDLPNKNFASSSSDFTIENLKLTSPIGGEYLQAGKAANITWQSTLVNNLTIQYSTDAGSSWNTIVTGQSASALSYSWTIPAGVFTDKGMVRIFDEQETSNYSQSASSFRIGNVVVTSPNGGELLNAGNKTTLTWTNTSNIANVKIEYSTNSGTSWNTIIENTTADGSYDWNIPASITSDKCLIRISDAESNLGIKDQSDNPFVIDALILQSPNGGENFQVASVQKITWKSVSSITNVKLEFKDGKNGAWNLIANNVAANSGTYDWTVPNVPSDSIYVKVSDPANPTFADESAQSLRIANVALSAPNGSEKWQSGTTHDIKWSATANVDSVDLYYSPAGSNWLFIVRQKSGNASYYWTVPSTTSQTYSVKVTDSHSSGAISDTSDSRFVVSNIKITQPSQGENILAGSTLLIKWNSTSDIDTLELRYSLNNGSTWNVINRIKGTNQQYSWKVPAGISSTEALLSLRDFKYPQIADTAGMFAISASSLVLNKPNGGESIISGTTYQIKWVADASVKTLLIELSTNNGTTWSDTIANAVDASLGSYQWSVPQNLSTSAARIKISDALNPFIADSSDASFTVGGLQLIAPSGGERWQGGNTQNITWQASTNISNIKIEFSTNNGTSWQTIVSSTPANALSYAWTIPNISSNQALVKLSDVSSSAIADTSSSTFTISLLRLTSPNGGEDLQIGKNWDITWVNSSDISQVMLEYSTDGTNWKSITTQPVSASLQKYTWNVSGISCSATNYIRIYDFAYNTITDVNDANFNVKKLEITSPAGGENWQISSKQTIEWSYCNVDSVVLEYSLNNGNVWNGIDTVDASKLKYTWTLPADTSTIALVRVEDLKDPTINAVSNNFNIFTPSLSLISPNGGENFQAGKKIKIKWSSIWINALKIQYSFDNGASWTSLENSYPAESQYYYWTLPDTFTTMARVKLTDVSNGSLVDSSANPFKISRLRVLSPVGGEFWTSGSKHKIKWKSEGSILNVSLKYTLDDSTWNSIPGGNTISAAADSFVWNIGQGLSSKIAKVKVISLEGDSIEAVSPDVFKIGRISIISPSGGEILQANKYTSVQWQKTSSITSIKIDLLDVSNNTRKNIATVKDTTNYSWLVGKDLDIDSARIILSDEESNYQILDTSNVFSIRTLRITSPDSNTNWMTGTKQVIKWTRSSFIDSVKLEFSTDKGATWNPVVNKTLPASDLKYEWDVPDKISSSACYVRITDKKNTAMRDTSDLFTIYTPVLTLLSPNGGEALTSGSNVNITWNAGFVTALTIEFSSDNGATWDTLASPVNAMTGYYSWAVPNGMNTTKGLIRIRDFSDPTLTDVSDGNFKIGWIKISSPSSGAHFSTDMPMNISWTASSSVNAVDIYYSVGKDTIPIFTNLLPNMGTKVWNNLPSVATDSLKIMIFDSESKRKLFASSDFVSIVILNLSYPNGGEFLPSGGKATIKWTASSNVNRIRIRRYTNSGGWSVVAPTVSATVGSYDWQIPSTLVSDSVLIEISDVQYPSVADTSDAVFRVGSLKLVSLTNGERIREDLNYKVTWSASSNIKLVEISYKTAKGNTWTPIVVLPSDSSYNWKVPTTPSNDCYIRVRDVNNTTLYDTNSTPFTIARLKLTSPVGGEYFQAGTNRSYLIKFEKQFVNNIKLEYTKDYTANPVKWENILIPTTTGTSYEWGELKNMGLSDASTKYKIRVVDIDYPNVADTVDAPITVSYLRLVAPNGGGSEKIGTQYDVKWFVSNSTVSNVNLAIKTSKDPDYGVPINTNPIDASKLSYIWNILTKADPSVRMKIYDADHPEIYDESDSTFIISSISLTSPNGGERWQIGKTYPISWTSEYINKVILQYNLTGKEDDWLNVPNAGYQNSSSGQGTFNWTLEDGVVYASDKAKVRIISSEFSNIRDTSKSNFTIVRLKVTEPNTRIAWNNGTKQQIKWDADKLDSVRILLDLGSGKGVLPVAGPVSATKDNPYTWTIPQGIATNTAKIIVRDYKDASIADTSDTEFVIGPSPVLTVPDKYQTGMIKIIWNFDTPGEKLEISGLDWKFSNANTFSSGGLGLIVSQNQFTGPVIDDTIKWNSKAYVDKFEGFIDLRITFHSEFNVNYVLEADSVKIDNKAPEFDNKTVKITQLPFIYGWDKALISWKAAVDSSRPITVTLTSDSASLNNVGTVGDSLIVRDLKTATAYDFKLTVSDYLGNSQTYSHSFTTLNLADYNGDRTIDVTDVNDFVRAWSSSDSLYGADFYPYSGELPFVEVNGDMELSINDLVAFVNMWYYDKIHLSLPKQSIGNISSVVPDERDKIKFKKGETLFNFPINISKYKNDLGSFSVKLYYDNSVFDIDSVRLNGASDAANNIALVYNDSARGIIYVDYANLSGKYDDVYSLNAQIKTNLDRFNPQDSLLMSLTGVKKSGEKILNKNVVYSIREIPNNYKVYQNYPNPFNPSTTIEYDLPEPSKVKLVLYNILGQQVGVLLNKFQKEGSYKYIFDANRIRGGLSTGVYFYRFTAGKFVKTKKLLLLK